MAEHERLDVEKELFMRELKRIRAQAASKLGDFAYLADRRYFLMEMLGKGGFSEVFKVRARQRPRERASVAD